MEMKTTNKGKIFNEINITPLTDIFLVLLIIMMVMAPMFQNVDQDIKIPEISSGIPVEEKEVNISITKNAEFFLNNEPIKASELTSKLSSLVNVAKGHNVVVKADKNTKSKEIMKVLRAAQGAGFERLTVAGESLSAKEQSKLKEKQIKMDEY